jgi:hypothetical protein
VVRTLLEQNHTCEAVVQVPKVNAAHAALVVQLPVHVKRLVRANLHLAHPLARYGPLARALAAAGTDPAGTALVQRGVELVGPRGPVAVAVAVVVAEEVFSAGLLAPLHGEGLVDGREEVLGQVGGEGDDGVEVVGGVLGVEAPEEVPVLIEYRRRRLVGLKNLPRIGKWELIKDKRGRADSRRGSKLTAPNQRGRLQPSPQDGGLCEVAWPNAPLASS